MNIRLVAPPWGTPEMTSDAFEAVSLVGSNVWRDASIAFFAERDAKLRAGKAAPKGMQKYLNMILDERFANAGWQVDAGCFIKGETWVRVTFRHQMSLGSDFLAALKVCKTEGIRLAMILAASRSTLNLVTPNDAGAIISFEKLQGEMISLSGVIDIPLVIGELTPLTEAPLAIEDELLKKRPRDRTVPVTS